MAASISCKYFVFKKMRKLWCSYQDHAMNHGKHSNHIMIMPLILVTMVRNMAAMPSTSWHDRDYVSHGKIMAARFLQPEYKAFCLWLSLISLGCNYSELFSCQSWHHKDTFFKKNVNGFNFSSSRKCVTDQNVTEFSVYGDRSFISC